MRWRRLASSMSTCLPARTESGNRCRTRAACPTTERRHASDPAAFEYARASSIDEAAKLLDKFGEDAKVLAGGHSLIPLMRLRLAQPKAIVDINGIKGLDHIEVKGSKLHVGALTRHVEIQNSEVVKDKLPILAEVAGEVGDNQVRNMGTMGGVVAHADAAGDYPTIALMLDAEIVTNKRTIAAKDFF